MEHPTGIGFIVPTVVMHLIFVNVGNDKKLR